MKPVPNPYPGKQDTPEDPTVQTAHSVLVPLDHTEAIYLYVSRLKTRALRIQSISEVMLRLLGEIEDDEGDHYPPDALASIEDLANELHDLAMIAHTGDFMCLHRLLHTMD